jgi:replication factor C subunit 2/4
MAAIGTPTRVPMPLAPCTWNVSSGRWNGRAKSSGKMVDQKPVFQVCDQPHPTVVRAMIDACQQGDLHAANKELSNLWKLGYSASDIIIGTVFKVTKVHDKLQEGTKLQFLREIGFTHTRISNGVNTQLQLLGLMSRPCQNADAKQ